MGLHAATYLTIAAPLVGCLLIALLGTRLPARASGWLASAAMLASFVGAVSALAKVPNHHAVVVAPWHWLTGGAFSVDMSFYVDALSIMEMLVVSGVGLLIHVYSIGYMAGDAQERRFFAYLNLFAFAMLMLVMGGNFALLLVGWGLVGMASYLLIGFWHHKPSAVAAAKKAFVVNAVGDVGILLGLLLIFRETGKLDYAGVFDTLAGGGAGNLVPHSGTALAACLLLVAGAAAKSAQLPLHTWLPDAMEGPTPVSALIHAATMVTAGVYLVARMHPLFAYSVDAQKVVACMGALTLLVAGFIALVQTDIKRVIAYSTMSQIGYMFLAVGLGALNAGMFHLMTHAFFKALLFLGAGLVIHALHDEQDIRQMGGLRKHLPKTHALFLVGTLALAGIIPLSGFFSKDQILAYAFASHHPWGGLGWALWIAGLVGVLMTGIYSMRLYFLVFHGEEGAATKAFASSTDHHGEGPATMLVPVAILGLLSVVGGWLVIPGSTDHVQRFLSKADAAPPMESLAKSFEGLGAGGEWMLSAASLAIGLIGIVIAGFVWKTGAWSGLRTRFRKAEPALQAALGFDALFDAVFTRPAAAIARGTRRWLEDELFIPSPGWVAGAIRGGGGVVGRLQSGLVRTYALGTALSVVLIIVGFVWVER